MASSTSSPHHLRISPSKSKGSHEDGFLRQRENVSVFSPPPVRVEGDTPVGCYVTHCTFGNSPPPTTPLPTIFSKIMRNEANEPFAHIPFKIANLFSIDFSREFSIRVNKLNTLAPPLLCRCHLSVQSLFVGFCVCVYLQLVIHSQNLQRFKRRAWEGEGSLYNWPSVSIGVMISLGLKFSRQMQIL